MAPKLKTLEWSIPSIKIYTPEYDSSINPVRINKMP